jgi:hypothetical protein
LREKVVLAEDRMRGVVATSPDKAALAPLTRPFGPPSPSRGEGYGTSPILSLLPLREKVVARATG